MDLFTTSLTLAGAEIPKDRPIDGLDISGLLFGTGPSPRQVFFYYRGTRLYAARKGPYKAHFVTQSAYGPDKPVKHDPPLLYHLGHDSPERFDIAAAHPDVLRDIAEEVERHQASVVPARSQLEETVIPQEK
jgi:arylsulfatase A-like enzyme